MALFTERYTNQHGFFSGESSVVGDGSLILNSTGTGDIGASLGEGVKNIDVNSLKITSEAYGIYKSNTGACDAQIKAQKINVNAVDHAFYTDTHSVAFEDFDTLTFTSKEGHALQNNSLSANVSFKGADVSLISEGRGALSTMRSDKAITSFDVKNLTIQATINSKRSGDTPTTDDIRKSSAVFVDKGTLNATVQESISIVAKQGNGDAPYAVYVTNVGKLNFKANQMTFNSDARTIWGSGSGTSIHLDGEQVNVNSKSIGVIGLTGAQVVIDGKELNIDVANDTGWLGGLWTQNNTSKETIPNGATKLQVNAENTNIKVTATGESANAIGIVAFSNSTVEVTGNLKVDADSVIRSRGYSQVLINQGKLFKNPCCQAEWNKNVLFGFS